MTDAKFKLEDILNKQKAPPQILDLVHIKIESEEDYKGVIEKIPDYKIKPERVSYFPTKSYFAMNTGEENPLILQL